MNPILDINFDQEEVNLANGKLVGHVQLDKNVFYFLNGENGVGKSCLLYYLKMKISKSSKYTVSSCEQFPLINEYRVIDVIAMMPKLARQCQRAILSTQMSDYFFEKLLLNQIKEKLINQLSGGENQSLRLWLSIYFDSDIYFFDEPLNNLSHERKEVFKQMLNFLKESQKAVVLIDHSMELGSFASINCHLTRGQKGEILMTRSIQ